MSTGKWWNWLGVTVAPPLIAVLWFHPGVAAMWLVGYLSGALYTMVNAAIIEVQEMEAKYEEKP